MGTTVPVWAEHFWNRLFSQLSFPMQSWVRQQAGQIVRSRRFGLWEEMRLNDAIQQKLQKLLQSLPPGGADVAARSILKFLVLVETARAVREGAATKAFENIQEVVRNKRQEYTTQFENFDQKVNQLFSIISTIVKAESETAMAIIRNLN